jgi:hypothetical protein
MSGRSRFTVTVVRLSGESRMFENVAAHWALRGFKDFVAIEMGVTGQCALVWDDTELDPERIGAAWSALHGVAPTFRRVELRHYGIYNDVTLTLVAKPGG